MRIAMLADMSVPNARYRAYLPALELTRHGHDVLMTGQHPELVDLRGLETFDVLYVYRHFSAEMFRVVKHLRTTGIPVVWDNDDDLTSLPKGNPLNRKLGGLSGERVRAMIGRIASLADLVTTTSPVLADIYRRAGASKTCVIENYLPNDFVRVSAAPSSGIVVGWAAAKEHQAEVEALGLRPMLQELLEAHADVRVVSLGLGLGLAHDRYEHILPVPFDELSRPLSRFDIGIAPLANIRFNRSRSNVKLKEYAALGIPWLASPTGPYVDMGPRQGGRLVQDGQWMEEIVALIADARGRRRLSKDAVKWAKGETIGRNVGRWLAMFEAVAGAAAGRKLRQ